MSRQRGTPKTGGRQKGTPNKRTAELLDASMFKAECVLLTAGKDPFDGDAHALLISVYKNEELPLWMRIDAAGRALPYEKPRLSSIEAHVDQHVHNHAEDYRERLLAEMDRIAAAEQAKAAPGLSNGRTTH